MFDTRFEIKEVLSCFWGSWVDDCAFITRLVARCPNTSHIGRWIVHEFRWGLVLYMAIENNKPKYFFDMFKWNSSDCYSPIGRIKIVMSSACVNFNITEGMLQSDLIIVKTFCFIWKWNMNRYNYFHQRWYDKGTEKRARIKIALIFLILQVVVFIICWLLRAFCCKLFFYICFV